jgi:hypothetical protein
MLEYLQFSFARQLLAHVILVNARLQIKSDSFHFYTSAFKMAF